jgi:5-hydroxyisourate hydrolase
MTLSTHVLDAVSGRPAQGVPVRLERAGTVVAEARTDADGRVRDLGALEAGVHRLTFDTAVVFPDGFYPEVVISFTVADPAAHHHVPLLLSPFAYSTYRGS